MLTADDVLAVWIDELGPEGWYAGGAAIDARIRDQFEGLWHDAMAGACGPWLISATGALAYLVLTDQFPRNMFRDTAAAFASDPHARAAAKMAIDRGWDMEVPEPERQFFYLPLMHSEKLVDQDRCVDLFTTRTPGSGSDNLIHAQAHRDVIRRFGRFPTRNAALGRETTPEEAAWLAEGGYGAMVRASKAAAGLAPPP